MDTTARTTATFAAVALLTAAPAFAQEAPPPPPTVVEGLVVDASTGLPFPGVQIRFDTGERITSDEQGRYRIQGVEPGEHLLALVTSRCNATFATLTLSAGEIRRVAFSVPSEVLERTAESLTENKRSEGKLIGVDELRKSNARNLFEFLRREAPDMVGPEGSQPGTGAVLKGRTRTAQGTTRPVVVLDGLVMSDAVTTLRDLTPRDIASIEILKGAGRGWAYGTDGAGGVIRIETMRGSPGHGQLHPDRCEIGDWTGRDG